MATPPLLMVFDLLYRAGRDQTKRPLRDRRARLEEKMASAERNCTLVHYSHQHEERR
jgi:ATP-dependent DNA ligase